MFFEIRFAEITAVRFHERIDLVRDLALVKNVAPFLADQAQRVCERGILEDVAFRRRAAFAVERVGFEKTAGQPFIYPRTERPVIRDQFRDGETFLRVMNRRREIVAEFEFAEFFVQLGPRVDRSRHTDRQHAGGRNALALQLRQLRFHLLVAQAER